MAPRPSSLGAVLGARDLGSEQKALLDLIDKLRFARLNDIRLPQVVVVGDQSAGKSSVLEAITGVPFPRDAEACTRFPTEVRLRRAKDSGLSVQIIPGPGRSAAERANFASYSKVISPDDKIGFENLIRSANEVICPPNVRGRFAARDRLRVDCWGPDKGHLSFVDLPGLVGVKNKEQSEEDKRIINDLADEYMKSSRSVILAIVGGNTDYIHQTVLEKVHTFDPNGVRTIGVVTKPDLTKGIGLEDKFIKLVNGEDIKLDLGWHVLLNGGPGEVWSVGERKQHEAEFFSKGIWRSLSPDLHGADNLWARVSVQLQRHIAFYVPKLLKEIELELEKCETELASLGSGKDTVEEMKLELGDYFTKCKYLIDHAVDGNYKNPPDGPEFFPLEPDKKGIPIRNLRASVVEDNTRFAEQMETQGRKVMIIPDTDVQSVVSGFRSGQVTKREYIKTTVVPTLKQGVGLEQAGDSNPVLVYKLFQSYSGNWDKFAQDHKRALAMKCKKFLEEVVDAVWPERMQKPLWNLLLNGEIEKANKAADEEFKLLAKDRNLFVRSYNPEYERRVQAWRKEQSDKGYEYSTHEEFLEKMLIFYDLTVKTFTSNLLTQVIERHLLQRLEELFGNKNILNMNEKTVQDIAAEDTATRNRRIELKKQKKDIEECRDACESIIPPEDLRAVTLHSYIDDDSSDDEGKPAAFTSPTPPARPPKRPATPQDAMPQIPALHNSTPHNTAPTTPARPAPVPPATTVPTASTATPPTPSAPTHSDQTNGTPRSKPTHSRQRSSATHHSRSPSSAKPDIDGDYNTMNMPGTYTAMDYNNQYTAGYNTAADMPPNLVGLPEESNPSSPQRPQPNFGGTSGAVNGAYTNGAYTNGAYTSASYNQPGPEGFYRTNSDGLGAHEPSSYGHAANGSLGGVRQGEREKKEKGGIWNGLRRHDK